MYCCPKALLKRPVGSLNLGDVLAGSTNIQNGGEQSIDKALKTVARVDMSDVETPVQVDAHHLSQGRQNGGIGGVLHVINRAELDDPGYGGQEWHIVDEADIHAELDVGMMFKDVGRNRGYGLNNNKGWLPPNGFTAHCCDVGTKNINGSMYVFDGYWGVSEFVVTDKVHEGVVDGSAGHCVDASG